MRVLLSLCRYFVNQVDAISLADGKYPVRWEEVWTHFGTQLDKRTIIHAWLTTNTVVKCEMPRYACAVFSLWPSAHLQFFVFLPCTNSATSNGYQVIWSIDGLYYLDNLQETWQTFYDQVL
jgi:hypothetical protein